MEEGIRTPSFSRSASVERLPGTAVDQQQLQQQQQQQQARNEVKVCCQNCNMGAVARNKQTAGTKSAMIARVAALPLPPTPAAGATRPMVATLFPLTPTRTHGHNTRLVPLGKSALISLLQRNRTWLVSFKSNTYRICVCMILPNPLRYKSTC